MQTAIEKIENIGALRKKNKETQLILQEKALNRVHEILEEAIDVLVDGMGDEDPYVRIRCAEDIIRKVLPDRKVKEITGDGGGPVRVETIDKRAAIVGIVAVLDGMGFEELRQRVENGSKRIFDIDTTAEVCEETEVAGTPADDQGREGPGSDTGPRESSEGVISSKERPGRDISGEQRERSPVRPRRRA
jgi:hypothetical protein